MEIEKGFYYHFRHDPNGPVTDCVYEMIGTAFNTETITSGTGKTEDPTEFFKDEMVIYRPLYDTSLVYKTGKRFWVRPALMFLEIIEKEGKTFQRFQKITDPAVVAELEKVRDEMYK
jgi:hypothetical protein